MARETCSGDGPRMLPRTLCPTDLTSLASRTPEVPLVHGSCPTEPVSATSWYWWLALSCLSSCHYVFYFSLSSNMWQGYHWNTSWGISPLSDPSFKCSPFCHFTALGKGRVSTSQNKEDKGGWGSDIEALDRKGKQSTSARERAKGRWGETRVQTLLFFRLNSVCMAVGERREVRI